MGSCGQVTSKRNRTPTVKMILGTFHFNFFQKFEQIMLEEKARERRGGGILQDHERHIGMQRTCNVSDGGLHGGLFLIRCRPMDRPECDSNSCGALLKRMV